MAFDLTDGVGEVFFGAFEGGDMESTLVRPSERAVWESVAASVVAKCRQRLGVFWRGKTVVGRRASRDGSRNELWPGGFAGGSAESVGARARRLC